jgi:hypothetical protein
MSSIVHVLIGRTLGKELSLACVAFVTWTPMVECIHMLYGSLLAAKLAITCLAFIVIVHIEVVLNLFSRVYASRFDSTTNGQFMEFSGTVKINIQNNRRDNTT